ncbi:DUF2505 domain-containing protein [Mycobacterium servetii]|uniref:DUF2505 domain-containing protein n=1 Tax=Mycobacterium servetii TaxID=3237418 RepID=A0ABV4C6G9_9MYCO
MPRTFDIVTESSASVGQVHAAFSRKDYWLARHEAFDASTSMDSLTVDPDGTVTMHATQYLGRQLLPGAVARLVPGDIKILHSEMWTPVAPDEVRGEVRVSAPGGLGSGLANARLVPAGPPGHHGSQLLFAASVEVKIPLLGGKLENAIGANLAENIPVIQHFTTAWIAEHS